jgi:hypothetical protein
MMTIALTLLGGVVGAALLRAYDVRRDNRRARKEVMAALRILRDELRQNASSIHANVSSLANWSAVELQDAAYMSTRLRLSEELPAGIRAELARWYHSMFPMIMANGKRFGPPAPETLMSDPQIVATQSMGRGLIEDLARLDQALLAVLVSWGAKNEPSHGPFLGAWQVKHPRTGKTPFEEVFGEWGTDEPITDHSEYMRRLARERELVQEERAQALTLALPRSKRIGRWLRARLKRA